MTPRATIPLAVRAALVSSYEDLRRVALSGAGTGRGAGFALFLRGGMARWMDTCTALLARPAAAPPPPRHGAEQWPLDPDVRLDVARVLTQMALSAHPPGAPTC